MFREQCTVIENRNIAPGHRVLRLASARISRNAKPGQFVQILCANSTDPLLPRPFSFLSVSKKDFSILYQVVGCGTNILSQAAKGDSVWVLGPLGNGFSMPSRQKTVDSRQEKQRGFLYPVYSLQSTIILVGGGVGIPPLYHLAQHLVTLSARKQGSAHANSRLRGNNRIHVFLGARNSSLLLCEKDFKKLGVDIKVSTDDGSKGTKGFVTEILEEFLKSRQKTEDRRQEKQNSSLSTDYCLPSAQIFTCGPTPMLKAVATVSKKHKLPCEVSVEVPMACGFGACLGCAIEVDDSKGRRFAVACTEGPVFCAKEIVWK